MIQNLSVERRNEIAYTLFVDNLLKKGTQLMPNEVVRDTTNLAKKLEIPPEELACFFRMMLDFISHEVDRKLSSVKNPDKVEK